MKIIYPGSKLGVDISNESLKQAIVAYKEADYQTAYQIFSSIVVKGCAVAQCYLGIMFSEGKHVDRDASQAIFYFTSSAKQNFESAQYLLGEIYYQGILVERDYQIAFKWFIAAAEKKNILAQYRIGMMYVYGQGVQRDCEKALHYFTLAADESNTDAQYHTGMMHAYGRGTKVNYSVGFNYLYLAANNHHVKAQREVGFMLETGRGTEQNYDEAKRYYGLSCNEEPFSKERFAKLKWQGRCQTYTELFFSACIKMDKEYIKYLLTTKKVDIDARNQDGATALFLACVDDDPERITFMVEQGANDDVLKNRELRQQLLDKGTLNKIEQLLTQATQRIDARNRFFTRQNECRHYLLNLDAARQAGAKITSYFQWLPTEIIELILQYTLRRKKLFLTHEKMVVTHEKKPQEILMQYRQFSYVRSECSH